MGLSHRQIEILYAVISSGSVTQAAMVLQTSQPSVSRELKEIQRLIGYDLFDRVGRGLQPTTAAMRLYEEIRRSYVSLGQVNNTINEIRDNIVSRLNLACLPAYATTLLPLVTKSFLAEYKDVYLSINSFEQVIITNGIMAQHYDIGIIEATPNINLKAVAEITVGEEVCILPVDHPLSQKAVIEPEDFANYNYISFSQTDALTEKIDQIFERGAIRRNRVVETTTATAVCAHVASGVGVSIINPIAALHFLNQNMVIRRFSVSVPYTIGIYHSRNAPKYQITQNFIRHCMMVLETLKARISSELVDVH